MAEPQRTWHMGHDRVLENAQAHLDEPGGDSVFDVCLCSSERDGGRINQQVKLKSARRPLGVGSWELGVGSWESWDVGS